MHTYVTRGQAWFTYKHFTAAIFCHFRPFPNFPKTRPYSDSCKAHFHLCKNRVIYVGRGPDNERLFMTSSNCLSQWRRSRKIPKLSASVAHLPHRYTILNFIVKVVKVRRWCSNGLPLNCFARIRSEKRFLWRRFYVINTGRLVIFEVVAE